MQLIITNNKEKYLDQINTIERPKLITFKELNQLIFSEPKNLHLLNEFGYEYKKVLLKNIMYATNDVRPELKEIASSLGIRLNNIDFLSHYTIESDCIVDPFILKLLPNIKINFQENKVNKRTIIEVCDFFHECQYITNQIASLIDNGIDINLIKVVVPNEEYKYTISLYLSMSNINYIIDTKIKICKFKEVKELLKCSNRDEIISNIMDINDDIIKNKLINIVNSQSNIVDIIKEIKNATVTNYKIEDAVEITNLKYHNSNYVIVAGIYKNSYTLDDKDNDFFSDQEKIQIGLKTSFDKTKENYSLFHHVINNAFLITKPKVNISGVVKDYFDFNIEKQDVILRYCQEIETYNYVNYELIKKQYDEEVERYHILNNRIELPLTKDFQFQKYNQLISPKISASSIELYNKCNYSYYLKYILKLRAEIKETWNLELGTFIHHILEYGYHNDEIEVEIKRYLEEKRQTNTFDIVEEKIITNMIPFLYELIEHTKNQFYPLCKLELEKYIESKDINLVGYIDKYIEVDNNFMILDYKTGNAKMNFDFIHHGIEIQNMLYAYIIEKENPTMRLKGTFRQKVKPKVIGIDDEFAKLYNINGKLDINSMIDYDFVKIQQKSNGDIYKTHKLERKDIDLYYKLIEENINLVKSEITSANFSINPKKCNDIIDACKYCDYCEVCYKTSDSYVKISKMEVENEL